MSKRIQSGIPHRIGACACQLGKNRGEMGVIEAKESTTDFSNVVGNAPRDPKHRIYTVAYSDTTNSENGKLGIAQDCFDDTATSLVCALKPWSGYSDILEEDFDIPPKLIYKVKGDTLPPADLPSITITLRPCSSVLNYQYTGNANPSGEGEIGFESLNPSDDFYKVPYYASSSAFPNYFADPQAHFTAWEEANNAFVTYCLDNGDHPDGMFKRLEHQSETYWREADRPPEKQEPHIPLADYEIEPKIYPRHPQEEAYKFLRNESYDFRYRYPSNYFTKYGTFTKAEDNPNSFYIKYAEITLPQSEGGGQGTSQFEATELMDWGWSLHENAPIGDPSRIDSSSNPEFPQDAQREGVAPIIKGFYWDSNTPPVKNNGVYAVVGSQSFKTTKVIRKRYPYSFRLSDEIQQRLAVIDHFQSSSAGNRKLMVLPDHQSNFLVYAEPARFTCPSGTAFESAVATSGKTFGNTKNTYSCDTYWRLEVDSRLADWNSKKEIQVDPNTGLPKTVVTGATIKGYIQLASYSLVSDTSQAGYYSGSYIPFQSQTFFGGIDFSFISPSVVFTTRRRTIGFSDTGQQLTESVRYDAGQIPWEVKLTEANCKGKPMMVKDIRIAPNGVEGWQGEENSLVFVHDFVVTEVTLP